MSTVAIGGIIGGIAAAIVLLGVLAFYCTRRRSHRRVPSSPHIYPEEAYLYDPHISTDNSPTGRGGAPAGWHQDMQQVPYGLGLDTSRGLESQPTAYGGAGALEAGVGAFAAARSRGQGYSPVESDARSATPPPRAISPQHTANTAGGETAGLLSPTADSRGGNSHQAFPSIDSSMDVGDLGLAPYRDAEDPFGENPFSDQAADHDGAHRNSNRNSWLTATEEDHGLVSPELHGLRSPEMHGLKSPEPLPEAIISSRPSTPKTFWATPG